MAINVNVANAQAGQLSGYANQLVGAKNQLSSYKSSISTYWQGQEVSYIVRGIDQTIAQIDSVIKQLNSLSSDIKSTAATIKREDDAVYRGTLELKGNKPDEYTLEISLTGFFTIESDSDLTQDLIDDLITKNSVAIIMPYLRSEVSLLTAQPETESVILPVFNVNNMIDNQ